MEFNSDREIKTASQIRSHSPNELLSRVVDCARAVARLIADEAVGVVVTFPKFSVQVRTASDPVLLPSSKALTVADLAPLGEAVAELMTDGMNGLPRDAMHRVMELVDQGLGIVEIHVEFAFMSVKAEFVNYDTRRVHLFTLQVQEILH